MGGLIVNRTLAVLVGELNKRMTVWRGNGAKGSEEAGSDGYGSGRLSFLPIAHHYTPSNMPISRSHPTSPRVYVMQGSLPRWVIIGKMAS